MTRPFYFVFLIVTVCTFAISSMSMAGSRENNRLEQGKITKNEAQHLVLNRFPGATIKKCELTPGKGHSVWIVDLVKAGAHDVTQLQVDGLTGKILP
jgi:uncharacterized membrane protein YkoI